MFTTSAAVSSQVFQSHDSYLRKNVQDLFSLKDRVIAVTGGGQGIGLALALACAESGAKVAIIDAKAEPHKDYAVLQSKCSKVEIYQSDVTDADALGKTFESIVSDFGRLDGCITAAGVCPDEPFLSRTPASVRRCFDINIMGTFLAAQIAAKHIIASKPEGAELANGSIVMIGSIAAHRASIGQYLSDYCASKGAVVSLAKEIAVELSAFGVRANVISPGYIMTDMIGNIAKERPGLVDLYRTEPPMKRIGDRTDLKGAAVYLLSDASAYMTGSEMLVTGGLHVGNRQT